MVSVAPRGGPYYLPPRKWEGRACPGVKGVGSSFILRAVAWKQAGAYQLHSGLIVAKNGDEGTLAITLRSSPLIEDIAAEIC